MLKKILRYLGGVLFIVFIYFNYIKQPEIIEVKKEDKMVTTGVSYDVEKYHIEAKKQIDDTKKNIRFFEKALAKFDDMKITGDNAKVDATNNLYLNNNIFGEATNGWKLEANEAHYDTKEEKIYASNQVKAYNEEKGITLYGDSLVTDTKLNDLNLRDDIRLMTKNMQLSGNYAHYNNTTEILELKENIKIRGRKLGALQMDEISGLFTEITYDGKSKIIHSKGDFVLYYKGATLRAKDFVYDEKTGNFTISEDVVVGFATGKLTVEKINYIASENKMKFVGPIRGTYGEYDLEADDGTYDSITGILNIDGNIKINVPEDFRKYLFYKKDIDLMYKAKHRKKLSIPELEYYDKEVKPKSKFLVLLKKADILGIKGKYNKRLYSLLGQFKKTGIYFTTWDKFKEILEIPKSYKSGHIDQKIFTPAKRELLKVGIEITEIKKIKKGRSIDRVEIRFKCEEETSRTTSVRRTSPPLDKEGENEGIEMSLIKRKALSELARTGKFHLIEPLIKLQSDEEIEEFMGDLIL